MRDWRGRGYDRPRVVRFRSSYSVLHTVLARKGDQNILDSGIEFSSGVRLIPIELGLDV
jgi:hypothetical protein